MPAWAIEWRPIDPAELALKGPKVEANADAEVIFWDVRIEDRLTGEDFAMTLSHYIRIKIFTDRGKERYSTVEIQKVGKRHIGEVAGRTIKPDGTIIELKKDAIFERDLAKTKGFKAHGTTFVLPNVEVGDIIEYHYKEFRDNETADFLPLQFQMDIPIEEVTYHLKPLSIPWLPYGMRTMGFHASFSGFKQESQGFYFTSLSNVPAFKEEPMMPPEEAVRIWMLVYYEEDKKLVPEKFWKEVGRADWNTVKPLLKVDDAIKSKAEELTAPAKSDIDKLRHIDAFCRAKIRNLSSDQIAMTSTERKAVKENKRPSDTLKQMAGTPADINMLFIALADAAGFDARYARIPDRGRHFFDPQIASKYFLRYWSVAVKVDEAWVFFDPATPDLMPGTLRWQEEGQQALVSDPKGGFFTRTQFTAPAMSERRRSATMKLTEEGDLEGTLEYLYTGHIAGEERRRYEGKTPSEIEEDWKIRMGQFGSPTISKFEVAQKDDATLPLIVRMNISIPGYAARTGKRILLEPCFFEHNSTARFAEATRKWDVYFHFAYSEGDDVSIELPAGWELDKPSAPLSSKLSNVGDYQIKLSTSKDQRKIFYRRAFTWGTDGTLVFPAKTYDGLKTVFGFVQAQDHHVLTLKRQGVTPSANN
jgi:hypothetical protein